MINLTNSNKYDFSALVTYLDSLRENAGIPACGVCIMKEHKKIFSHYSGYADREGTRPAAATDTYWLYSSTKVSTAVSVLQLVERGLLSLKDPLFRYLPEYEKMTVRIKDNLRAAVRPITIENLLTMTAGFAYNRETPAWLAAKSDKSATTRSVIRAMSEDPLEFDPGDKYMYSLAFDVLGALIEVISGRTLEEYFRKNIAEPLGMTETTYKPCADSLSRLSEQYEYGLVTHSSTPLPSNTSTYVTDNYLNGGGGLISTIEDYLLLADALANDGVGKSGARILTAQSIDDMTANHLTTPALMRSFVTKPSKYGYGYGFGVRVHLNPGFSLAKSPVGEFGWSGAAGHYMLSDRKNRLSLCFGMHVKNCAYAGSVIHPRVRDLTYEALGH